MTENLCIVIVSRSSMYFKKDKLIYCNNVSLFDGAFNDDEDRCTNEKYGKF